MKICGNCKEANANAAEICENCGADISREEKHELPDRSGFGGRATRHKSFGKSLLAVAAISLVLIELVLLAYATIGQTIKIDAFRSAHSRQEYRRYLEELIDSLPDDESMALEAQLDIVKDIYDVNPVAAERAKALRAVRSMEYQALSVGLAVLIGAGVAAIGRVRRKNT